MTPLKTLLVTLPDQPTPSSIKLDKDAMKLGRHADINEIHVPVGPISSNHCEFIRQGETYALRDLDSTNGTRINGERITEPVALKDGDVILLGETITAKFLAKEEAKLYETPSVVAAAPRQPAPSPVAPVRTPAPGAPAPTVKLAPPTPTPGAPVQPSAPVAPLRKPGVPVPSPAAAALTPPPGAAPAVAQAPIAAPPQMPPAQGGPGAKTTVLKRPPMPTAGAPAPPKLAPPSPRPAAAPMVPGGAPAPKIPRLNVPKA